MLVIGSTVVSAAAMLLGLALIVAEFRRRWPQVLAAFDIDAGRVAPDPLPPLTYRPVVARRPVTATCRAPAGYRLAA